MLCDGVKPIIKTLPQLASINDAAPASASSHDDTRSKADKQINGFTRARVELQQNMSQLQDHVKNPLDAYAQQEGINAQGKIQADVKADACQTGTVVA